MDSVQKYFMFCHWIKQNQIALDNSREQADTFGFYSNPELYKKVKEAEANTVATSDEDFDEATRMVEEFSKAKPNNNVSKKRRKIKNKNNGD